MFWEKNDKIKIMGFVFTTPVEPGQRLNQHCGPYTFDVPDLLPGNFYDGEKKNIWTLGVRLYFMVVGKVQFYSVIIQELRRQVVTGVYPDHYVVSEELEDLLSLLMVVNPRYSLRVTDTMMQPWFKKDCKGFPNPDEDVIPLRTDPAIVEAMDYTWSSEPKTF